MLPPQSVSKSYCFYSLKISLAIFSSFPFHPPVAKLISRLLQNVLTVLPAASLAVGNFVFLTTATVNISKEKPNVLQIISQLPITVFTTGGKNEISYEIPAFFSLFPPTIILGPPSVNSSKSLKHRFLSLSDLRPWLTVRSPPRHPRLPPKISLRALHGEAVPGHPLSLPPPKSDSPLLPGPLCATSSTLLFHPKENNPPSARE